jgi:hypothetical protein
MLDLFSRGETSRKQLTVCSWLRSPLGEYLMRDSQKPPSRVIEEQEIKDDATIHRSWAQARSRSISSMFDTSARSRYFQ